MTGRTSCLPAISIAVINYNGADVLPATLAGIDRVRSNQTEVFMLDDGSDDGSPEWAERTCSWLEVVRMGRNTGRPNLLRNRALERAAHRFVFLADNDVVLHPGCLERLCEVLTGASDVVCCTPRLLYQGEPGNIYHDGGGLHYLCISTEVPRGRPAEERPPGPPCPTLGGGIMLVDRERAAKIGNFDEGYRLGWGDDGEFHFRCRISGYRVLQVSDAVCEHFERRGGERRIMGQLYNRYRLLFTGYSGRTLLLLSPPLLLFEIALTALALGGGFLCTRFAAAREVVAEWPDLRARRREIQSRRRVADGDVLQGGRLMQPAALGHSRRAELGARAVTTVLDLYWKMVCRWV